MLTSDDLLSEAALHCRARQRPVFCYSVVHSRRNQGRRIPAKRSRYDQTRNNSRIVTTTRRWQSLGRHQKVECPNVYYDRAENRQAERNEAANQEKQAADDLEAADDVNVAAGKNACKYSPVTPCGRGGIGRKCRNPLEPKKTKINPRRIRAIIVKIFIRGQ